MAYLSEDQVLKSISELRSVHPFHGITFVACKKCDLPVGRTMEVHMDGLTKAHLDDHHRLSPQSSCYYQPFNPTRSWVKHDYASSGLQAINTQTFKMAFVHTPGTRRWGWSENYLEVISGRLKSGTRIPVFDLAVWLYRTKEIADSKNNSDLVEMFLEEYRITPEERDRLFEFDRSILTRLSVRGSATAWRDLRVGLRPPPDAGPEGGGTLGLLELVETGPAKRLSMEPAERLTLITGDNGLGKTFLLECAWWALSGSWAGRQALPRHDADRGHEQIRFSVRSAQSQVQPVAIQYDWSTHSWPRPTQRPTIAGLVVYARVDGSFAVWDPAKPEPRSSVESGRSTFSNTEVWDGRPGDIEGIVRDWGRWQSDREAWPFQTFVKVLRNLSPPDLGPMLPGELKRIPNDLRDIPTIQHVYGETPILFESAGVKRVLALAYLMVWAWKEHQVSSQMSRSAPESRMVVLIDEVEAHLHPKWQRQLLPAIVAAVRSLASDLSVQLIVTTHSPLVLASAEPVFDEGCDALLHLRLGEGEVSLSPMPFVKYGDASRWLTSPVFDMTHARSQQAESAIEGAKTLQLLGHQAEASAVQGVTDRLREYLPSDDPFWPRWIAFAEDFGVGV